MRKNNVIITIDYETWQPIPDGKRIDWKRDILNPAEQLMDACVASGAKLTFFVEVCELIWLEENDPDTYSRIKNQIKDIIRRKHDVQLHMHPNWLPELGARLVNGKYEWNPEFIHLDVCPGDIGVLIKKCKDKLESIVRQVDDSYRVKAFRAGGYRVQPFDRIQKALIENGIYMDTSVYKGGKSSDRGYDFSSCKYNTRPYFTSTSDPCMEDKKKYGIVELPITCYSDGERFFIDNEESEIVGKRYLSMSGNAFSGKSNYYTLIGHTKADHDYKALSDQLAIIGGVPGTRFTTISDEYDEIIKTAGQYQDQTRSINEVKEIVSDIYNSIQPGEPPEESWVGEILLKKQCLCLGYVWLTSHVLKAYGYKVHWLSVFADDMPNGRGIKKTDSHELIELDMDDDMYIVCPTSNRILRGSIKDFLSNPQKADTEFVGNYIPDDRFISRHYDNYITSFFFKRAVYYRRRGIPLIPQPGTMISMIKRQLYYLFAVELPLTIRHKA